MDVRRATQGVPAQGLVTYSRWVYYRIYFDRPGVGFMAQVVKTDENRPPPLLLLPLPVALPYSPSHGAQEHREPLRRSAVQVGSRHLRPKHLRSKRLRSKRLRTFPPPQRG